MRYLVTFLEQEPFLTKWFDAENNFNHELGMVVFDLQEWTYTKDGIIWDEIPEDHL